MGEGLALLGFMALAIVTGTVVVCAFRERSIVSLVAAMLFLVNLALCVPVFNALARRVIEVHHATAPPAVGFGQGAKAVADATFVPRIMAVAIAAVLAFLAMRTRRG